MAYLKEVIEQVKGQLTEALTAEKATFSKDVETLKEVIKGLEEKSAAQAEEISKATAALSNPAFADAATVGQKPITGGDSKASETGDLQEQLKAEKDPAKAYKLALRMLDKQTLKK